MTDATGQTTRYTYDASHRLTTETDPLGNTRSSTYDQRGNLLTRTDAEGQTVTFTYDPFGRRIAKTVEEQEHGTVETKVFNYVYDQEDVIVEVLTTTETECCAPALINPVRPDWLHIEREWQPFGF